MKCSNHHKNKTKTQNKTQNTKTKWLRTKTRQTGQTIIKEVELAQSGRNTTNNSFSLCTYFQIRHFLRNIDRDSSISRSFTPFEHLCSQSTPQQHVISNIYNMLFLDTSPKPGKVCVTWEREMQLELSEDQWDCKFTIAHKALLTSRSRKTTTRSRPVGTELRLLLTSITLPFLINAGDAPGCQVPCYISGGHAH